MFASASLTVNASVAGETDILFDSQAAMSNASLATETGTIQLAGSGTVSTFRVAWGVATRWSCKFELMVDGVAQLPLTFGSPSYNGGLVGGEALVTIPDNAAIRLRASSYSYCNLSMDEGGVGSRAFLTVMKIS
jgi:hypothetical protein